MVRKDSKNNCFYCEECEMAYNDKNKAYECESWCKKNKSCNLEITKYSLNIKEKNEKN